MAAAASLKTSYRITRIETVDAPQMPGMPSVTKVMVTGVAISDPAAVPNPAAIPQNYQWQFDDADGAAQFFNVNEVVDVAFTKVAPPAAGSSS